MKKVFAVLIAVMLLFSIALCGCNGTNTGDYPYYTEGDDKPDGIIKPDDSILPNPDSGGQQPEPNPDVPDSGGEVPEPNPDEGSGEPEIPDVPDSGGEVPQPNPDDGSGEPEVPDVPDSGGEVPEPNPDDGSGEPEIPDVPDSGGEIPQPNPDDGKEEQPTQDKLLIGISDTLWKDGNYRYKFNEDGTVTVYAISKDDFNVSEDVSVFKWYYKNELLYFADETNEELVEISTQPIENINSQNFKLSLTRCDTVFIPMFVFTQRNVCMQITAAFENGEFIFKDGFAFFEQEGALTVAHGLSKLVYAYPADIKKITVTFGESYKDIILHNYISDDFIFQNDISLPIIEDDTFVCWRSGENDFTTVYEVIEYMTQNSLLSLDLQPYFVVIEPDPIEGEYTFTYRNKEFRFVFDKANFYIYDPDEQQLCVYFWKFIEDEYRLSLDESEENFTISVVPQSDGTYTITNQTIKDYLGMSKVGKIILTKVENT